jgi:hypothetical protein
MRSEGSGKGDQLRYGVDWKAYGSNYDAIFKKPLTQAMLNYYKKALLKEVETGSGVYLLSAKKATRKK